MTETMAGIAVRPLEENTLHLRDDVPVASLESYPDGRGVKLRILQVGVCGTDKEINQGLYGAPPPGSDYLVLGHEAIAEVAEVGPNVVDMKVGDIVTPTVRRPSRERYDRMRFQDLTSDDSYFERGISMIHGFLCETIVEHEEFLVKIEPPPVQDIGVLMEPMSVVQKAVRVAWAVQQARLPFYQPKRALITGAGPIGQLGAMLLRLRGLEVVVAARTPRAQNPIKVARAEEIGAHYESTEELSFEDLAKRYGKFDIIIDATGSVRVAFDCLLALAKNGVCAWTSITGGTKTIEVRGAETNQAAVLGNQLIFGSVNAHIGDFESGVHDFALGEKAYPGWLSKLLSHRVDGLADFSNMMDLLHNAKEAVKIWVEVSKRSEPS